MLLALAVWQGAARASSPSLVGIAYPPNALFLVAFGFVLLLLLHFSLAVSRLSDQTKVLAQRLALLEDRQRPAEEQLGEAEPTSRRRPSEPRAGPRVPSVGLRDDAASPSSGSAASGCRSRCRSPTAGST